MEKKYEMEDILEMLGGTAYFNHEQIQFVYHRLNGHVEEAEYWLKICEEHAKKLQEKAGKMTDMSFNMQPLTLEIPEPVMDMGFNEITNEMRYEKIPFSPSSRDSGE